MLRWSAALLSLPFPGLGHALAGALPRALLIATIASLVLALFAILQTTETVTPTHLILAAIVLVTVLSACLAAAADAWRLARAPSRPTISRPRRAAALAAVLALNVGPALLPFAPVTWRNFYIPSGSMHPTLRLGDRFVVQAGWYDTNPVQRGEIIVFTYDPTGPNRTDYVKRAIGLAGDRIRMVNGTLLLNGTPVPSTRDPADPNLRILTLPDGPAYTVAKLTNHGPANNTPEFLVPPGHVFGIGDSMDNSDDSRTDSRIRYIPTANLIGRAAIIYWPFANGRFGTPLR